MSNLNRSYSPLSDTSSEPILDPSELSRIINGDESLPRAARFRAAVWPHAFSDVQSLPTYDENDDKTVVHEGIDDEYLQFSKEITLESAEGDGSRQMAMLLSQLDLANSDNRKLQHRLQDAERLLERMRLDAESRDVEMDALVAGRAADMVDSIAASQRERDDAIMNRLRLANKERDDAISRAGRAQNDFENFRKSGLQVSITPSLTPDEQAVESMLRRLETADGICEADSPVVKENRVSQERDIYFKRAERLQKELDNVNESRRTESQQLAAVTQERDMVQARLRRLEDEMQTLRVYYSLHKSLASDLQHINNHPSTSSNNESKEKLVEQLKMALADRFELTNQLHEAQEFRAEAEAKASKFERLVNVLRKKLASQSQMSPVH